MPETLKTRKRKKQKIMSYFDDKIDVDKEWDLDMLKPWQHYQKQKAKDKKLRPGKERKRKFPEADMAEVDPMSGEVNQVDEHTDELSKKKIRLWTDPNDLNFNELKLYEVQGADESEEDMKLIDDKDPGHVHRA